MISPELIRAAYSIALSAEAHDEVIATWDFSPLTGNPDHIYRKCFCMGGQSWNAAKTAEERLAIAQARGKHRWDDIMEYTDTVSLINGWLAEVAK